jgi:hypothetical protein
VVTVYFRKLVVMMVFQKRVALQLAARDLLAEIQMAQLEVHMELLGVVVLVQLVRMVNHLMVAMVVQDFHHLLQDQL